MHLVADCSHSQLYLFNLLTPNFNCPHDYSPSHVVRQQHRKQQQEHTGCVSTAVALSWAVTGEESVSLMVH